MVAILAKAVFMRYVALDKLTEVQKSVEIVLKESAGEWKTVPFESGETEDSDEDDDRP